MWKFFAKLLDTGELERVRTLRQQAEASLEYERHQLHTMMDHLPDAIYFKDKAGKFQCVSRALAERLGLSDPAEAVGKTDADFFPAEYAARALADEQEMLRTGRALVRKEENPRWPDGTTTWVLTTKAPLFDGQGRIAGTFGISHDITELKETEQALRTSQERFQLAVKGSTDGLWDWNVLTNEVSYAPRFKELLGYAEDEMEDTFEAWRSRLHSDDLYPTIKAIDDHLHHRLPYDVEYRLRTKRGMYRWYRARGQAVWDERGQATRMAGSITDITDRKSTEDALQNSQRLYLSLVENLPVHLIRKDLDGKFTFANQAFCKLLGKSPDAILGTTDFDYYPNELAEKYRRDDQWVANTGKLFEDIEENDDGKIKRYFEIIKTPVFDASSRIVGTQGIFWDVTARKRAEIALQEAKEAAEAANRAKSEFLANMSHEIRTPMNAIIGMTELVLETDLTGNQREYLATVLEASESLLSIINQILDFSKIEAGRIELDPIRFELREVLGSTMKSLALRAHRKGLELAWRVADDVPATLEGDLTRLRQVVVNLVGNAIKFTDEGEVILSVSRVSQMDGEAELKFSVKDTGIGIPPDKLETIFEAFQQADTSTTRRFGGTGLGLAISSRLAQVMGGRVWVESRVGSGSSFHFTARLRVDRSPVGETVIETSLIHGTHVLVVDDNATNRQILDEMLRSWGMSVHAVDSGSDALDYLIKIRHSGERPQVVVTDVNMPGMDGFMLSEQIRQDPDLHATPIIMLTSGGTADLQHYRRLGVSAHLLKPVKQSELFDAVAVALGAKVAPPQDPAGAEALGIGPLRILLAEDGLANQKLAIGVLQKWGHFVTVANNGKEAVGAWESGDFDMILMDVQMPEMDGLDATKLIRQREKGTGRHIAIVAMTAHAMGGDREKCLAAGMDGYVAKPVRKQALHEAIEPLFREHAGTQSCLPHSMPMLLDMSTALAATDGDVELLQEVVQAFLEECPRLLDELQQAIRYADAPTVQRAAHTIKGAVRLFPDSPVRELAGKLEEMGRAGDLTEAPPVLGTLKSAADTLFEQLGEYLTSPK